MCYQAKSVTPVRVLSSALLALQPQKGSEDSMAQVLDNEGMGDTGFEPVTSTACRKQRKNVRQRK
jgi:hypothetical protein